MIFKRKQTVRPGKIAWKRFSKNKPAVVSLAFIVVTALVALLGYLITPDATRNADWQELEIATVSPGTRIRFVYMDKKEEKKQTAFWNRWLFGASKNTYSIPCKSYHQSADSIYVEKYISYRYGQTEQVTLPVAGYSVRYGSRMFLLGTDAYGRDVLSRLMIGSRISLMIGTIAVIISLFIGVMTGAVAGYYRGITDSILSWLMNVTWSIPTLLLVISISLMLNKGLIAVFIAVGFTMWVDVARIVRGQFLSFREKEFVEAGRALGYSDLRIIIRHIMPNILAPVLVIAASNFASALLIESGLSFLGFGVQPPVPSWGNMIETNRNFLITDRYHLAIIPGVAIMLLVLAFTMVGDGIRKSVVSK